MFAFRSKGIVTVRLVVYGKAPAGRVTQYPEEINRSEVVIVSSVDI